MDYKALAQQYGGTTQGAEPVDFAALAKKFGGKSAAYTEGADAPGAVRGLASVMQGPTFGFADEIGGVVGGTYKAAMGGNFGDGYRGARDFLRGAADAEQENNPIATAVTRGMAAAPTMLLGRAKAAIGMMPNMLAAGRAGAVTGGIGGLGSSTATDLGGAALDTALGSATGGVLGAGTVPVARGMGSMYENVAARVNDSAAMKYAKDKVAEAFARDARGRVAQGTPGAVFPQAAARMNKLGAEGRVVDSGGQSVRQLLDTVATLPGQSKSAVENAIRTRQAGRADRMIGSAEQSLQTGGQRAASVVDDLVATREQAARPLYGRLHSMEVGADPELATMLQAAESLGAGKVARDIATAARVPYSLSSQEWQASGGRLAMRDLDHMKQGLDTLIAKQTDPVGKVSPLGYRLQGLRADLLAKLDDQTAGFYKTARDAFAGPSALIDATSKGRRFMTADEASTRQALAGLSESEREAFRIGAFEALRNKIGRPSGQTEVIGMWKDKILREKLQTIFPNERAFREFAATASREGSMKGLESVGRGSQTAGRQFAAGDLDVPAVADAVQTLSVATGPIGLLAAAGRQWNRVQTPEPVRNAMGNILLGQGAQGRASLSDLEANMLNVAMRRNRNANALGVGLGGQAANPLLNLVLPR